MTRQAIVTGASRGIGLAITKKLIQMQYEVVGIARSFDEELQKLPHFTPYCIDLSDTNNLPKSLKELSKKISSVDTIVCNAGRGLFGHLEEFSFDQISELMDLNFLSQVFLIKMFLPQMKKAGKGNIILMGSQAGLAGKRKGTIYCASKFALRGFAQALRDECASKGIRVTLINPGMVKTPFFDELNFLPGTEEFEYIEADDISDIVEMIIQMREGTVIDEVSLSPRSKKVFFKKEI